jgi:flagellar motor switch protein FliM
LEAVWRDALQLQFQLERRDGMAEIPRWLPPQEKVLSLRCELRMSKARGILNMLFPTMVSNTLLKKLEHEVSYRHHTGSSADNRRLREVASHCRFQAELLLPLVGGRVIA